MAINSIVVSHVMFSPEHIKEINKEIQKYVTDQSVEYSEGVPVNSIKKAKVHYVPCSPLMGHLHPFISFIQRVNREVFGYNLFLYFDEQKFNYNVYEGKTKDEYNWHTDGAPAGSPTDIKLTCLLNLSEDTYDGGDRLIYPDYVDPEKEEYNEVVGKFRTPGTAIIFHPQRLHKVLPVTKGKRITLTYWARGPAWK